jgi:hypothetical protein
MSVSVLIVDDEPHVADLLRQQFRRGIFVPGRIFWRMELSSPQ